MTRAILLISMALAFAAAPEVALAQGGSTHAPSRNPVASQYSEMVPTAGGGTPSGGIGKGSTGPAGGGAGHAGGGSTGSAGASIPSTVVKRLNAAGAAGKATAALDQATARTVPPARAHAHRAKTRTNGPTSPAASQVIRAATGSSGNGGLGLLLPVILAVSLVCASVAGILKRRGTS